MQRVFLLTGLSAVIWLAFGCGQGSQPEQREPGAFETLNADQKPKSSSSATGGGLSEAYSQGRISQTVEAGCAKCVFKMKDVETCELAVKIDGTPYLVYGVYVEPEESGLCDGTQKAQVVGRIVQDPTGEAFAGQNAAFVADSVEFQE